MTKRVAGKRLTLGTGREGGGARQKANERMTGEHALLYAVYNVYILD